MWWYKVLLDGNELGWVGVDGSVPTGTVIAAITARWPNATVPTKNQTKPPNSLGVWTFSDPNDPGSASWEGKESEGIDDTGAVPGGAPGEWLTGPQYWQGQFEQQLGIPTGAETPYAQYRRGLGSQYILPYALQAYEEEALGVPRTPYADYLSGITPEASLPGGGSFRELRGMSPEEQMMFFAEMGIDPSTGQRAAFRGALRERGTLPWMARIMSQRAFRDAPQRAWAGTEAAALEQETYLDALARKYAIAG